MAKIRTGIVESRSKGRTLGYWAVIGDAVISRPARKRHESTADDFEKSGLPVAVDAALVVNTVRAVLARNAEAILEDFGKDEPVAKGRGTVASKSRDFNPDGSIVPIVAEAPKPEEPKDEPKADAA